MRAVRILLVDDEESLRLTTGANLELEGFEIVEAANADEALELARTQPFDIVLSDIRMPGLSGVDLHEKLREIAPDLPVLLMTAFTTEKEVNQAIESGVFAVLSKPFDIEDVVAVLHRALKKPVVVVVDDVESVAITTVAALRAMGLRAISAGSGEEALRLVGETQVDVCVTDLVMPGMNGLELVHKLRELDPTITVIVFSGAAQSDELMRGAVRAGAYGCLRKPLDPPQLARAIAGARNTAPPNVP